MEYRTQKILLTGNIDDETQAYLLWCCEQSNKLYNSVLFAIRQAHFGECNVKPWFDQDGITRMRYVLKKIRASYPQLCKDFKESPHYQAIGGQQGQQTIKSVIEGIKGYNELLCLWFKKEIENKPKIPNYRKQKGLYQVAFTSQNIRYDVLDSVCYLPIANVNKKELETGIIAIPGGNDFDYEQIAEVRIVPENGMLWAEYVYKIKEKKAVGLDYSQAISIDYGLDNWLTVVSTLGKSFIVNGRKIKSINQRFNRFVSKRKQGKDAHYWDDELAFVTSKRNRQIRDAVNKAARFVINYCLHNKIGNIVFGWNIRQKDSIDIGKTNNQNFVQIPTARLKKRIQELAESVGIGFTETEEAYSSKASFLDNDLVPRHGEKPSQYKFSGKRIKRGLYRTKNGLFINSDCNGSANILRKVATQLNLNLAKLVRGVLALPKRYDLTVMKKSYRKRAEAVIYPAECPSA